ncbi:unnamed protein product (mitochondrion) [Plasmodiophora brassicae]|uniref:Uncharacterized protein n=1 Tax=Plasmodiophora brassicae TaxID=37360 RepID=A0A3P3Y3K5_PLABS|nr:unnamed protein product [Plasmodiophora brassicae]
MHPLDTGHRPSSCRLSWSASSHQQRSCPVMPRARRLACRPSLPAATACLDGQPGSRSPPSSCRWRPACDSSSVAPAANKRMGGCLRMVGRPARVNGSVRGWTGRCPTRRAMGQACCRHLSVRHPGTIRPPRKPVHRGWPCPQAAGSDVARWKRRECPITLQSFDTLRDADDIVLTWCCRVVMSGRALLLWITDQYGGSCCPNCRSQALIPQLVGPSPGFFEGAHAIHILASEGRQPNAIRHLISDAPSSIRARDCRGRAPLHIACRAGHLDVVRLLCEAGANPNDVDRTGETVLGHAQASGNDNVVNLVRKAGGTARARRRRTRRATTTLAG